MTRSVLILAAAAAAGLLAGLTGVEFRALRQNLAGASLTAAIVMGVASLALITAAAFLEAGD